MTNVRALRPTDGAAARTLLRHQFSGSRYCERLLEQLDLAIAGDDSEYAGLLALDEHDAINGILLYGFVAGASAVLKVHALAGKELDPLVSALIGSDPGHTARLFICELPDDASAFGNAANALHEAGFIRESRVRDFFTAGVSLDILTRPGRA